MTGALQDEGNWDAEIHKYTESTPCENRDRYLSEESISQGLSKKQG